MTIREINELIETSSSLKSIAQAYGEIALLKIKKIRAAVERNRQFFQEIAGVYRIVRTQAVLKKIILPKKKKTVSILLTSNYRFYGSIDAQVTASFLETTPRFATDRIVVGKTGNEYLKAMRYFHQYTYIELRSDLPNAAELADLTNLTRQYSQIIVFYPQLSTILVQQPKVLDITQFSTLGPNQTGQIEQYVIFEPEIDKIIEFFENQINTLLLEQTFFESELARTGSRILAMDQGQIEANKFIAKTRQLLAKTKRGIEGNRMLENISTFLFLKKEKGIM